LGDSSVARGKQEVAMGLARDSHAAAPWDSTKKTMPLCKEPPSFAGFPRNIKIILFASPFVLFGNSNYFEVFKINMDFLT
jgi:hypothetical protein